MADDARLAELRGLLTAVMVELLDDHGLFDMGLESEDAADALVPVVSAWAEQEAARRRSTARRTSHSRRAARSTQASASAPAPVLLRRWRPPTTTGDRDERDNERPHPSPSPLAVAGRLLRVPRRAAPVAARGTAPVLVRARPRRRDRPPPPAVHRVEAVRSMTMITDHEYRPDRQGQWLTGRCDLCGEPETAHGPVTGAAPDRRQDQRTPCVMCTHGAIRHYRTGWGDGGCNDCNCPGYEPDTAALAARPAPDDREVDCGPELIARCDNQMEPHGERCQGSLRYRWGQIEAACDTCGGRCGVAVAPWVSVAAPFSPGSGDALHGKLAEALKASRYWSAELMPERSGSDGLAAALLPVVREAIADELDAAAKELKWAIVTDEIGNPMDVVRDLRARAGALRDGTRA